MKYIEIKGVKFKEIFVKRYQKMLEERFEEFIEISLKPLKKSIRINTIKVKDDICNKLKSYPFLDGPKASEILKKLEEKGWKIEKIPFYEYGFWVEHEEGRRDIGNTVEFQLGYYYSQEAASMIPPIVLDPKPGEFVLDLCAAPGSKTTQMAMHMENKGIIIANDIEISRIKALAENLQRCGVTNTIITRMDGRRFIKYDLKFDKILIDAPCSGTGAIRKSYKTIQMYNINMINRLSKLQKQLIKVGFEILKEGGILVYSTCSLEPEENEEVIDYLLNLYDNAKVEKIEIKGLKRSECILEWDKKEYNSEIKKCLRIYPQDNDTEGFFVAKIRKI